MLMMMYIVIKIPVHKNLDYKKLKYQTIDHNVQGSKNILIFHYLHQLTNGPDVRPDDHDSWGNINKHMKDDIICTIHTKCILKFAQNDNW